MSIGGRIERLERTIGGAARDGFLFVLTDTETDTDTAIDAALNKAGRTLDSCNLVLVMRLDGYRPEIHGVRF